MSNRAYVILAVVYCVATHLYCFSSTGHYPLNVLSDEFVQAAIGIGCDDPRGELF